MGRSKIVKTPIGKIKIGPNTTPSSEATKGIVEMENQSKKIARSGSIPVERLKDGTTECIFN